MILVSEERLVGLGVVVHRRGIGRRFGWPIKWKIGSCRGGQTFVQRRELEAVVVNLRG